MCVLFGLLSDGLWAHALMLSMSIEQQLGVNRICDMRVCTGLSAFGLRLSPDVFSLLWRHVPVPLGWRSAEPAGLPHADSGQVAVGNLFGGFLEQRHQHDAGAAGTAGQRHDRVYNIPRF